MDTLTLNTVVPGISVIIALAGFYLVIKILPKWNKLDINIIKARVFLDKKFLEKNGLYVLLAGASMTSHQLIDFIMSYFHIASNSLDLLSEIVEFMSLVFLVALAYEWLLVLNLKK